MFQNKRKMFSFHSTIYQNLQKRGYEQSMRAYELFYEGCPYHIETSPLIRCTNQWTSFYMRGTSFMGVCSICPC